MTAQEWQWLKEAHLDRTEQPSGGGFTYGDWRRAREQHSAKMRSKANG